MEGFTYVDGGVAVVILISAILAYSRGLVREVLSIAGWVVAAIVAYVLTPAVEPLVREIPVVSDIIGESCEICIIVYDRRRFSAQFQYAGHNIPGCRCRDGHPGGN